MADYTLEIKRLSLAIKNAFGIITHKKLSQVSENAIEKEIVTNNRLTAEVAVAALKGVVPQIDTDGININAFTLRQREELRELITRTLIYQRIKEYKGGTVTQKPIEFNLSSVNQFTDIYNATQLQSWLIPGKWVEDNTIFIAPTFNARILLSGSQPLNHGWDQSKFKPAEVGVKDGRISYDINNLGFNVMPVNGWFNYVGFSDSQRQYGNRTENKPETSTGTSEVGQSRRTSFNYETVFGSPFSFINYFAQSSMVLTGEYFTRKDERVIETKQDPSIHSQGYNIGMFETLRGPLGIGGYLNQEWGTITPVANSDFGFARTVWGLKGTYTGLTKNYRYKVTAFGEVGSYTQGTAAGSIEGDLRNPSRPSLGPLYSTPRNNENQGKKLNAETYDQSAKGVNIELEYLNKGGFAPIVLKLGAKDYLYMRDEPVWKYNVGLGLGRWVGVDYSLIYNNIPENLTFSKGKRRDMTQRVDGFVYLDLMGIGSKKVFKKETELNAGLRLSGWYMRDDHTPHNPVWGLSLGLEIGFNTGVTKKTRNVNRAVIPSKFYVAADESPNNRTLMENYYEREYISAGTPGATGTTKNLLEDGMLIRPIQRSNP